MTSETAKTPGKSTGNKSSSRSSSQSSANTSVAHITVQCALAAVFFGIWIIVGSLMYQESLPQLVIGCMPYFAMYVLGVLSRYVPGVKSVAKRLKSAMPT